MSFIAVYVTFPDEIKANEISEKLLSKKIIACYNSFPIKSCYWWNGDITNSNEIVCLLKTRKENWKILQSEILAIHPYDVPCIMKFEVEANESYEKWIYEETTVN